MTLEPRRNPETELLGIRRVAGHAPWRPDSPPAPPHEDLKNWIHPGCRMIRHSVNRILPNFDFPRGFLVVWRGAYMEHLTPATTTTPTSQVRHPSQLLPEQRTSILWRSNIVKTPGPRTSWRPPSSSTANSVAISQGSLLDLSSITFCWVWVGSSTSLTLWSLLKSLVLTHIKPSAEMLESLLYGLG
eukprot:179527-Pelagomonas_calceolata.AAC.1